MIRHVVVLTFTPGTTDEQVAAAKARLDALPALIPQIRAYTTGPDIGGSPGHGDFAVVGDFDDLDACRAYLTHPAHVAAVTETLAPIIATRIALQIAR